MTQAGMSRGLGTQASCLRPRPGGCGPSRRFPHLPPRHPAPFVSPPASHGGAHASVYPAPTRPVVLSWLMLHYRKAMISFLFL